MSTQKIDIDSLGEIAVKTSSRSKSIRLKVVNGQLLATKPKYVPLSAVKNFILRHKDWARQKLDESREETVIHNLDVVAPDVRVVFESSDSTNTLVSYKDTQVIVKMKKSAKFDDNDVQLELIKELKKIWRKKAKEYIPNRLKFLAETHGFEYNKLRLKDIKTRWGSCSSKNNININIQLIKLDDELIDHVLLHELSHTKAMNHGEDFWKVFESVRKNAREERRQLKQMTIF